MTQLYRHFDRDGNLLYIGISVNALTRLRDHRRARWFGKIARVEITHYRERHTALREERRAIETERPIYNRTLARPPRDVYGRFTPARSIPILTKLKGAK